MKRTLLNKKNFRLLIAILFIIIGIWDKSNCQDKKLANTLLWEVSRSDLKGSSYLFGTMHVSSKTAFHLQDSFLIALSNVDYVGLELNPEIWLKEMCASSWYNKLLTSYYNDSYYTDFYEQATQFNFPDKYLLRQALVDNGDLVNNLLYRFADGSENRDYEEMTYLDLYIYQFGKKLGKRIMGLEDFDESMEMALKAMLPDKDAEEPENSYNEYAETITIVQKLEDAYRNWNLSDIDSLMQKTFISKNYEKYMFTERNKNMLRRMDSVMQLGSVFCGVGAAHLPGENGLINLLRANGYTVKPVLGEETFAGRKRRSKIESKIFSHTSNTYFVPDSSVRYSLPGKLIEVPNNSEHQFLLYPDMVNGGYYVIYRLQHYSRIFGQTETDVELSIDSILYENIPGKILMKNKIVSNNGYPGVALSTKLVSGEYMQFHIYFTPLEIIIFKAGGLEEAYRSATWKKFFGSVTFQNNREENWYQLVQNQYNYSIDFPAIDALHNFPNESVINSRIQGYDPADSMYYFISVNSLNDFEFVEDDTFELNYLTYKLAKQLNAQIRHSQIEKYSNITVINTLYSFNNNSQFAHSRLIPYGNRFYILLTAGNDTIARNRFFNSFKFTGSNNSQKDYLLTDSTMFFWTKSDDATWDKDSKFDALFSGAMNNSLTGFLSDVYKNNEDEQTMTYYSKMCPSAVRVKRVRINEFEQVSSIDTLITSHYTGNSRYGNYISKNGKFCSSVNITNDSIASCTYLIKDHFSERAIMVKKLLINDHIYSLATVIDTNQGPNSWQSKFYEHFTPWDTCPHFNITEEKTDKFIHKLYTKDSVLLSKEISYTLINLLEKNSKVSEAIINYLKSEKYKALSPENKCKLISLLGYTKSNIPSSINALKEVYREAADTFKIQNEILTTLAKFKNPDAILAINELMEENLPLPDYSHKLWNLFYWLSDSLELSKALFPSILNYMSLQEYKSHIVQLMADMVIKGHLSYPEWKSNKQLLLREAQTELKRYNAKIASKETTEKQYSHLSDEDKLSSDLPWDDYKTNKSKVACYSVILSSEYENDQKISKFIDDVMNTHDRELVFTCAYALKGTNQLRSDTIWSWLASDDNTRMYFCDWLEQVEDTLLYPKEYYSQENMAIAWIKDIPKDNIKIDSIQFIKRMHLSDVKGEGYVYFYKYKEEKDWKLNYVGFQPTDTTIMVSDYRHHSKKGIILKDVKDETLNEAIEDACYKIRFSGRKRIRNNALYSYDNFMF